MGIKIEIYKSHNYITTYVNVPSDWYVETLRIVVSIAMDTTNILSNLYTKWNKIDLPK